ncbi:metal-dependent hydrolase family protein [Fuerstiella marisgermanici]|nr:amidohydrolase family protein [Fuerstiella marisgermanici]
MKQLPSFPAFFFSVLLLASASLQAQTTDSASQKAAPASVLINNARIFDGNADSLSAPMSVLIEGDKIKAIGASLDSPENANVIDAGGRVLTPGFIDCHTHIMLQVTQMEGLFSDEFAFAYRSIPTAETMLMNGFTSVRDASGNSFSLKAAIDRGLVDGPRIYPSGPMISQTSGHSDFRSDADKSQLIGGGKSTFERYGMAVTADGRTEVMKAVRENLRRGASQIKLAVSGGVTSSHDPLYVQEFTADEIKAAVQTAEDYGTYVLTHAYNPKAIQRAIHAGVKSIEHANLIDEETLRLMKEKDVWLSPQVSIYSYYPPGFDADRKAKMDRAFNGLDTMFRAAKKIGIKKIVFGTDIISSPEQVRGMNHEFTHRTKWFSNAEILQQATGRAGELLALCGKRNPYPAKLGVIEEGAYADILLIDGNPLEDIEVLTEPKKNLALIMKGGKVFKNAIE